MPQLYLKNNVCGLSADQVMQVLVKPQSWVQLFSGTFEVSGVLEGMKEPEVGDVFSLNIKRFGFLVPQTFQVEKKEKNSLCYRQVKGIFKKWHHQINLEYKDGRTAIIDNVNYEMPFGFMGHLSHDLFFRQDIKESLCQRAKKISTT